MVAHLFGRQLLHGDDATVAVAQPILLHLEERVLATPDVLLQGDEQVLHEAHFLVVALADVHVDVVHASEDVLRHQPRGPAQHSGEQVLPFPAVVLPVVEQLPQHVGAKRDLLPQVSDELGRLAQAVGEGGLGAAQAELELDLHLKRLGVNRAVVGARQLQDEGPRAHVHDAVQLRLALDPPLDLFAPGLHVPRLGEVDARLQDNLHALAEPALIGGRAALARAESL
mmetsp:Transcript_29585/g.89560  ORF Transcript_29585/g.89560 Transcript_29585/m.89560 type:complete len:227 (+) Transcript_29585:1313-1993(+)